MIKVIVADDQYPVLEFLAQTVPWGELGLAVAAQCSDGVEALEACRTNRPGILISDIGMPKLNGLELIASAKAENPDLEVVILSCHDEFHYVREAIKLGVTDYIHKESLQPEELTELLRKIVRLIEARSEARDKTESLSRALDQGNAAIKSEFIRNTIRNPIVGEQKWLAELKDFGIADRTVPYLPVLLYPNRYSGLLARFGTEELLTYAFDNALDELIDKPGIGVSFRFSPKIRFILFPYPKSLKVNQYEIVRGRLTKLLSAFGELGIAVSAVTGQAVSAPQEWKKSLTALLESVDQRFYASEGTVYKWNAFRTSPSDIFSHYQKAIDDFRHAITNESDPYRMVVREWMQLLRDERYPAETVRTWLIKLLLDIEVKFKSLQDFDDGESIQDLHRQVLGMESIYEVEDFLAAFVEEKIRLVRTLKRESARPEIREAKKYVAARLHEKIGMEEAALALHLNPSHFSRIFKQETGETFIEYVTRQKMEKAKELLDHTGKSIEQIGEALGYDNTSYFIKIFKSVYGFSPKEYRLSQ
ncbi:helix-turn-helix domain-containing protein [Cohnella caldifontis]|uniref:helix-turn-helix domain-containing protein n=1 Tax=Cohnella caldifontis TaxID=3027471 RepID=UPI0023ED9925|nr:helix-turn-helix domain-containing protein [Cohnella sp. YIM B05605]